MKVNVTTTTQGLSQEEFEGCCVHIEPETGTLWIVRLEDKEHVKSFGIDEWMAVAVVVTDV